MNEEKHACNVLLLHKIMHFVNSFESKISYYQSMTL